jgi:hypothetical protein
MPLYRRGRFQTGRGRAMVCGILENKEREGHMWAGDTLKKQRFYLRDDIDRVISEDEHLSNWFSCKLPTNMLLRVFKPSSLFLSPDDLKS